MCLLKLIENKDVKPRKSLARFEADPIINTSNEYIGLSTPPRVLTMDTRPFPTVGENLEDDYVEPIVAGRSVTSTPQIRSLLDAVNFSKSIMYLIILFFKWFGE